MNAEILHQKAVNCAITFAIERKDFKLLEKVDGLDGIDLVFQHMPTGDVVFVDVVAKLVGDDSGYGKTEHTSRTCAETFATNWLSANYNLFNSNTKVLFDHCQLTVAENFKNGLIRWHTNAFGDAEIA